LNKVIVSLYGGLGNQLFQYSAAKSLALRNNAPLVLDLYWFSIVDQLKNTTPRNYALASFNVKSELTSIGLPWHQNRSLLSRIGSKFSFFSQTAHDDIPIYSENGNGFDKNLNKITGPIWLNGYWQSYKYFEDISDSIKSEIGLIGSLSKNSLDIYKKIISSQSICLHIRRGDYVFNSNASQTHGVCNHSYYKEGVKIAAKGLKKPIVFIFSDDPDWVRKNLKLTFETFIVDANDADNAHQDLWLMQSCQRFVIANSTLSWWAAWLSKNQEKIVVAPRKWFLSKKLDSSDLIPPSWVRI